MKKQVILELELEVNFPFVQLRSNHRLLIAYHAVLDPGLGCDCCALKDSNFCQYVKCGNVVYLPVFQQPCL